MTTIITMNKDELQEFNVEIDRITKENVQRGIDLLDRELGPDWPNMIDAETFDIASPEACVLGQLFNEREATEDQARLVGDKLLGYPTSPGRLIELGGFYTGLAILDGDLLTDSGPYGFSTDNDLEARSRNFIENDDVGYEDLPDLWLRLQREWDARFEELRNRVSKVKANV